MYSLHAGFSSDSSDEASDAASLCSEAVSGISTPPEISSRDLTVSRDSTLFCKLVLSETSVFGGGCGLVESPSASCDWSLLIDLTLSKEFADVREMTEKDDVSEPMERLRIRSVRSIPPA